MKTTTRRRSSVALAGLALLVGAAACGDTAQNPSPGDGAARGTAPAPAAGGGTRTDKVNVEQFKFQPEDIVVKSGTTVTFTFADSAEHNVTYEEDKLPKTPDLADGKTATSTFSAPGTYKYYCGIHVYMTGSVVVE